MPADFIELIKSRRSVRRFRPDPIPDELVRKLLEAGHWAPSANNSQPWRFILLKSPEVRRKVAEVASWGSFLAEAPLGIAVVVDPKASSHPVEDGAAATQNILLAAHALGLGACWIGSYGSAWEGEAKNVLGVPEGLRLLSVVAVGYPAERPKSSRRKLESVVYVDKYGSRGET